MCCTFDYSKLIGRIIEKYKTRDAFAKKLGIQPSTLSNYLGNKRALKQDMITQWAKLLDIPVGEYSTYFFNIEVHEGEQ